MIGTDPAAVAKKRTARANAKAGQASEHPPDIAAYIEKRRAKGARRAIPTPGAPVAAAAEPQAEEVVKEAPAEEGGRRPRRASPK